MVEVGKGSLEVIDSNLPGSSRAIQSRLPSSTSRWWGRQQSVVSEIVGAILRKQMLKICPWVFPKAILHPVQVIQAFAPRQSLVIGTVRALLQWKWEDGGCFCWQPDHDSYFTHKLQLRHGCLQEPIRAHWAGLNTPPLSSGKQVLGLTWVAH